jgi:hypothetical protein
VAAVPVRLKSKAGIARLLDYRSEMNDPYSTGSLFLASDTCWYNVAYLDTDFKTYFGLRNF